MNSSKVLKKIKFTCQYCNRSFQKFITLSEHQQTCELGVRLKLKDTEEGILAHKLWCISFKGTSRKKYEYKTFITHRDFKFFLNFAKFCCLVNSLDSEKYMEWCIKERIKQKLWTTEFNYHRFVKHYLTHEDPVDAVMRSINYIKSTGDINYFDKISPGKFINHLEVGKISPWLYLLYWNSNAILKRMNSDQLNFFNNVVDHSVWSMLQRRHKDICEEIKKTLKKETI